MRFRSLSFLVILAAPCWAASVQGQSRQSPIMTPSPTEVRPGQYNAAPWIDTTGGPRNAGRIVGSVEVMGIGGAPTRAHYQLLERLYTVAPEGASQTVGARFMTFHLSDRLEGVGQAVIPTGVLELERSESGKALVMRVVQQFGEITPEDGIIAMDSLRMPERTRPSAVSSGLATEIVWIMDSPVLPSLGNYVVLKANESDGLKPGDQFTLLRPFAVGPRGERLPDEPLAIVQVVRVGPRGTTAIIIDVQHGGIRIGGPAKLTAKM